MIYALLVFWLDLFNTMAELSGQELSSYKILACPIRPRRQECASSSFFRSFPGWCWLQVIPFATYAVQIRLWPGAAQSFNILASVCLPARNWPRMDSMVNLQKLSANWLKSLRTISFAVAKIKERSRVQSSLQSKSLSKHQSKSLWRVQSKSLWRVQSKSLSSCRSNLC